MKHITSVLANPGVIAFQIEDVDRMDDYLEIFDNLAVEFESIYETLAPIVSQFADDTGTYIVVRAEVPEHSFNFIDLFIDELGNENIDVDLAHIQVLTYDVATHQRYINARQLQAEAMAIDAFESSDNFDDRVLLIEQTLEYNLVAKQRDIIIYLAQQMQNYGIDVGEQVNAMIRPVFH